MSQVQNISFHGQTVPVFTRNQTHYVAMKPIVENIGLDWVSQHKKIQRSEILNSTMVMMTIVAEDGKKREMLCLPLDYLNGWLFGVDAKRVKPEIRERLLQYQRECFKVLNAYFNKPITPPRIALPSVTEQMPNRKELEQVVMMLGDRLKEIHNWGSSNLDSYIERQAGKPLNRCTYQEIVALIRRMHRDTQDPSGRPIVKGSVTTNRINSETLPDAVNTMETSNSLILSAVAATMKGGTKWRNKANQALYEAANLHEVLLNILEGKRYRNECPDITETQIVTALMEAGRQHNFISFLITE